MVRLLLGYIVGIHFNNDSRCIMYDVLTDEDSVMQFLSECSQTIMMVKRQELCNLIKYALRLDCVSNIALADVCLIANMVEEQTTIAIFLIFLCEMHDLRISFLCEKG